MSTQVKQIDPASTHNRFLCSYSLQPAQPPEDFTPPVASYYYQTKMSGYMGSGKQNTILKRDHYQLK